MKRNCVFIVKVARWMRQANGKYTLTGVVNARAFDSEEKAKEFINKEVKIYRPTSDPYQKMMSVDLITGKPMEEFIVDDVDERTVSMTYPRTKNKKIYQIQPLWLE